MESVGGFATGTQADALTGRRLRCCDELVARVFDWLGPVRTPQDAPWLRQRQVELVVRARQSMRGVSASSREGLWIPAYAMARMLLEDAAVAHWLAVHPDVPALERRWQEHLVAMRYGDIEAQRQLGLELDDVSAAWIASRDEAQIRAVAERYRYGASHWTGKSVTQLVAGASSRGAPAREDWIGRTTHLAAATRRMQTLLSVGVHHSPAGSQNWHAQPNELLPDALRVAWLAFALHSALALEDLAPTRFVDLQQLVSEQMQAFVSEEDS
jgi:hypothetical protein